MDCKSVTSDNDWGYEFLWNGVEVVVLSAWRRQAVIAEMSRLPRSGETVVTGVSTAVVFHWL